MLRMPIFKLLFCRVESMQMTVLYSNRGIRLVRRVQHPMFFVEGMHRKMIPSRMSKSISPVPTVNTIGSRWTSFNESGYFL